MSIREVSERASGEWLKGKNAHLDVRESVIRNPRAEIVIDFMQANLHRSITSDELAKVAHISSSHLSRLFKTQTGLSPGEYLRRLRMEKASDLVATSLLSMKEIMAMVGYDSKSHFVRHFRRSFRLAPTEYRKSVSSGLR